MVRRVRPAAWLCLLFVIGCVPDPFAEQSTPLVPANNAFPSPPAPPPPPQQTWKAASTQETEQASLRVKAMAEKILKANQQIGLKPSFPVIGSPKAEIFHRGTGEVYVTLGMVNRCTTDGQLAAVLCMELGKMASEREAQIGPRLRQMERQPPIDPRIGPDSGGVNGPVDMTRLAELAEFEKDRQNKTDNTPYTPPDPKELAHLYLIRAGYPASELDVAAPLLRSAAQNGAFERQILNSGQPAVPPPTANPKSPE
jgi:hypothetical protein